MQKTCTVPLFSQLIKNNLSNRCGIAEFVCSLISPIVNTAPKPILFSEKPEHSVLPLGRSKRFISLSPLINSFCKAYASVNSSCTQPPPPLPSPLRATVGHLPALSVPGVWHLQILHCPGARHLPNPGPTPSFWHARSFLSEYNYTEDFTWKTSRLAHLSWMGKNWRGL